MLQRAVGIALVTTLLASSTALADGFENIPTGSRTAAMGGAGIAGGSDSAMPTLNPAGLALIPGSIASVSASLYQYGVVSVPNFVSDSDTLPTDFGLVTTSQKGVESKEFASFPSAAAYFLHLGSSQEPTTLGISLSIPKSISRRFVQNTEYLGEGLSFKENTTHVVTEQIYMGALSWASSFGAFRTGASVIAGYTELIRTVDLNTLQVRGTAGFHRTEVREVDSENSFDTGLLAGVQYDVTDDIRVGATFRTPSLHVLGSVQASMDLAEIDSDNEPLLSTLQRSGQATRGIPMRVGVGLEVHQATWSVALDGNLFVPRKKEYQVTVREVRSEIGGAGSEEDTAGREREGFVPTKMVLNVGLGVDLKITDNNWIRAGAFTELSSLESAEDELKAIGTGGAGQQALFKFPIGRFGGSAGWGSRLGPVDTTLGLRVSYGSGKTIRINPEKRFRFGSRDLAFADTTDANVLEGIAFLSAAIDLSEDASSLMKHIGSGGVEKP